MFHSLCLKTLKFLLLFVDWCLEIQISTVITILVKLKCSIIKLKKKLKLKINILQIVLSIFIFIEKKTIFFHFKKIKYNSKEFLKKCSLSLSFLETVNQKVTKPQIARFVCSYSVFPSHFLFFFFFLFLKFRRLCFYNFAVAGGRSVPATINQFFLNRISLLGWENEKLIDKFLMKPQKYIAKNIDEIKN